MNLNLHIIATLSFLLIVNFNKLKMYFKIKSLLIQVILICILNTSFCFSNNDWHLKKVDKGITVYTRESENSGFEELKAITHLKTSVSSIVALLYDFEAYPAWVYKCGKSGTLKIISEKELIHYQTIMAPWPVDNRDFVVNIKIHQNKKTKVITINSYAMGNYIPVFPGYVRIMKFDGSWVITPQNDGTVEIEYQLLVDPGGYVPAWVVNMVVIEGPFETMTNIKERVFRNKYQKAKIPFIEEPEK